MTTFVLFGSFALLLFLSVPIGIALPFCIQERFRFLF